MQCGYLGVSLPRCHGAVEVGRPAISTWSSTPGKCISNSITDSETSLVIIGCNWSRLHRILARGGYGISYALKPVNVAGFFTEWKAGFSTAQRSVGVAMIGKPFQSNIDYSIMGYFPDRSRSTSNCANVVKPIEANRHDNTRDYYDDWENATICNVLSGIAWDYSENKGKASRKQLPRFFDSRQVKDSKNRGYEQYTTGTRTQRWSTGRQMRQCDYKHDTGRTDNTPPANQAKMRNFDAEAQN